MKQRLGPGWFPRALGVFVIALGASTWPRIHPELIIAGLGFYHSPKFWGKGPKE